MMRDGVFASRWPLEDRTLWTIVNRTEYDIAGQQMIVPYREGMRYFDLYHGIELKPQIDAGEATLAFRVEGHGYGAVLSIIGAPDTATQNLMSKMQKMTTNPLASYTHDWQPLGQQIVDIPPTTPATTAPEGMARVEGGDFEFRVDGIEIEGSNNAGVDVQYPWEDSPRRFHVRPMHIAPFYMDKYPVTNAEFKKFIDATHYRPKDDANFLKDWKDGNYPAGWGNKPVTWVSIEDAREYAKWAGKRLPHEWEWQYAAQGNDSRRFPWGDCDWLAPAGSGGVYSCPWQADPARAMAPAPDKGRTMLAASDVDAHPAGASPFGVMDMVGNVWQWTDEYVDEHTRAAILRGGSHYQPQGSKWYFPQSYRNDQHGKLLMMAPSYDRSGAVGFRCVKDTK
jgi:iron(II)-dependent oxidoreductase